MRLVHVQYKCMCKRAYMWQYPAIGFSIAIDLREVASAEEPFHKLQ